jgi:hypothetical protein
MFLSFLPFTVLQVLDSLPEFLLEVPLKTNSSHSGFFSAVHTKCRATHYCGPKL